MNLFEAGPYTFAPEGTGKEIDWSRLKPGEAAAFKIVGERVSRLLADVAARSASPMWTPSPIWCGADLACSHMQKPIDIARLMEADDLSLLACYMAIAGSIVRINGAVLNNESPAIARFQKTN